MNKPLAIDLYCGLGGWAEGLLVEGFRVVGFDIERHDYGTGRYPGQLVLQDARTLHGSQFKDAAVIVASPPCQKYSYMAMPWKKAKDLAAWYREDRARIAELNELFDTCFRIQREANEATGRYIPLIVENVVGAQSWVGRARWHFGSYYLWGDVPALMPIARSLKVSGQNWNRFKETGEVSPHWRLEGLKNPAETRDEKYRFTTPIKNSGGSWFGVAHNTGSGVNNNPVSPRLRQDPRDDSIKQGGDWFGRHCESSMSRLYGSKSPKRKAASAQIAKIPFPLARYIAQTYLP
jgi:hypothetical protein